VLPLPRIRNSKRANTSPYINKGKRAVASSNSSAITTASQGQEFLTDIQFSTQSFKTIIDTGSSDTWAPQVGFTCVDANTNQTLDESACGFGALFDPNASSTFTTIAGENFFVSYNDNEVVLGSVGNETITLAGIVVEPQEIGVVNLVAFNGDGIASGLLGLAFPSITSAFSSTDASTDQRNMSSPPCSQPALSMQYSAYLWTVTTLARMELKGS
jgi:hypothetical protein